MMNTQTQSSTSAKCFHTEFMCTYQHSDFGKLHNKFYAQMEGTELRALFSDNKKKNLATNYNIFKVR